MRDSSVFRQGSTYLPTYLPTHLSAYLPTYIPTYLTINLLISVYHLPTTPLNIQPYYHSFYYLCLKKRFSTLEISGAELATYRESFAKL